jgi:hypothetical protein
MLNENGFETIEYEKERSIMTGGGHLWREVMK